MVEFKPNMDKQRLQEIAAANGIPTDGLTKQQIIDALTAHNEAEKAAEAATAAAGSAGGDGEGKDTTQPEKPTGGAQDPAENHDESEDRDDDSDDGPEDAQDGAESGEDGGDGGGEGKDTTPDKKPAESAQDGVEEYDRFIYVGPSLPRGRLKANAVFNGTLKDVKAYLADVLEDYPQVARLIVPVNKLAAFSVKVKTPGNIAHKYYNDIVSAMSGGRKV